MWYMHEGMGWWVIFGSVWMFFFWGGLIALVVWAVTKLSRRGDLAPKYEPLDLARERYVKGEISETEFKQLKRNLS
jgi:putative membrane protein